MAFDALLGNETLKQRLSAALSKGKASHSYLLTGPAGSGKHTLAKLLSAALQCTELSKPCCHCSQCKKVLGDVHPDVITVDDPEHKTIPIKLIRNTCADLYIRPNEGNRKIYLFPRAMDLRSDSQNALLKCIEEPPPYGTFIFLAEHSEQLLTTIRSRCVELRLSPLQDSVLQKALTERFPQAELPAVSAAVLNSEGYLGKAMDLLRDNADLLPQSYSFVPAYCSGDPGALFKVLAPMEKLKRDQLRPILLQWHSLIAAALRVRSGLPATHPLCKELASGRSTAALLRGSKALTEALRQLEGNVGPAHICGTLSILLR